MDVEHEFAGGLRVAIREGYALVDVGVVAGDIEKDSEIIMWQPIGLGELAFLPGSWKGFRIAGAKGGRKKRQQHEQQPASEYRVPRHEPDPSKGEFASRVHTSRRSGCPCLLGLRARGRTGERRAKEFDVKAGR
jgi:hypothetical protein